LPVSLFDVKRGQVESGQPIFHSRGCPERSCTFFF